MKTCCTASSGSRTKPGITTSEIDERAVSTLSPIAIIAGHAETSGRTGYRQLALNDRTRCADANIAIVMDRRIAQRAALVQPLHDAICGTGSGKRECFWRVTALERSFLRQGFRRMGISLPSGL